MKIIVDEEGRKAIQDLCDASLKLAGINALNLVISVMKTLTDEKDQDPLPPPSPNLD